MPPNPIFLKFLTLTSFALIPFLGSAQTDQTRIPDKDIIHATINVTGIDLSSGEGSVSYSLGQTFFSSYDSEENYIIEGVQQPLTIPIDPAFIEEKEEKDFRVAAYPNPVSNYFFIEASNYNNRSLHYTLMDLQGRLLKEDRIEKYGALVNSADLPAAVYLLKITDNGKYIKTIRLIKK